MRPKATSLAQIELVVSDIDGTLVRADKSLAPATVEAVAALKAAGVGFTLISARPPSGLAGLIGELGLEGPAGAFNGATIFRPDGTIVEAHRLSRAVAAGMLDAYARHDIAVWIFADGRWMTRTRDMPHIRQEIVASGQEPVVAQDFSPWLDRVDKLQGVCDAPDRLARVEAELKDAFGADATIARSQPYYLDATAPAMDKGTGVRELARAFGVPLERVAVAGDMPNDLPMFRVAGFSVAMGQGPEEVRREADRVAASNEEDGLAVVLRDLIEAKRRR